MFSYMHDYIDTLTVYCKYTLVRKFSTTMPNVELIRKTFIQQTRLSGLGGCITHFNARHMFIYLKNELDYNTV